MTDRGVGWNGPSLGLVLSGGPGPATGWAGAARWFGALEDRGCEALWFTDHLFFPYDTPEVLTMAAVAAASTRACLIGSAVLQAPLRPAALVSKAVATIEALAPGRVVLGVGVGELEEEFRRVGAAFGDRGRALDESIDRWRELWSPGEGWFTQQPVPSDVPVWIGGRSEAALERVVARGDGWMPMFVSPEGLSRRFVDLTDALVGSDRAATDVTRAVLLLASVDSPAWGPDAAMSYAATLFNAPAEAIARHVVTGSAAQVADRVAAYTEAGAQHVAILPMNPDPVGVHASVAALLRHP